MWFLVVFFIFEDEFCEFFGEKFLFEDNMVGCSYDIVEDRFDEVNVTYIFLV